MGGFFGGFGGCNNGCGTGMNMQLDCCTILLLLFLLNQCGCNDMTWLILILLLCGCNGGNTPTCHYYINKHFNKNYSQNGSRFL